MYWYDYLKIPCSWNVYKMTITLFLKTLKTVLRITVNFSSLNILWFHLCDLNDFEVKDKAFKTELSYKSKIISVSLFIQVIHIISTGFSVLQTFSGFVCPNFAVKSKSTDTFYPAGLSFFVRLNCFLSNGRPGHLQFYSHSSDKLLFNVNTQN